MEAAKAPGFVSFDADEMDRLNRARLAIILGMRPDEVDAMSIEDQLDVLEINRAERELDAWARRLASQKK